MPDHYRIDVRLEGLDYRYDAENAPTETPHVFVYTITIENRGEETIRLIGRKWVITKSDGDRIIVEGDKIVGEEPTLEPGRRFTYNSFHLLDQDATADGSYFGIDAEEQPIVIPIPSFVMQIPHD
ncbi:MAG: ApaG domain [Verrucomicrobiota bacterium]